jgi:hypothetical protein
VTETTIDVRCPACGSTDLTAEYSCPVLVTLRDGEVWSVRVMDEAMGPLRRVTCDACGWPIHRPGRPVPSPVGRVLDNDTWPVWEIG